jgi:hypothetical protein
MSQYMTIPLQIACADKVFEAVLVCQNIVDDVVERRVYIVQRDADDRVPPEF